QALAFDRAARLYRLALTLRPDLDQKRALDLHARLAEALGDAGRGQLAAAEYLAAAKLATGLEAIELERCAAEHLMCSGHIDEGRAVLKRVLGYFGMKLPATPQRALTSLVWQRARIRLRGLRVTPRLPGTLSPEQLARVDACYAVSTGLGLVDTI